MNAKQQAEAEKHEAMTRLGVARRERLDKADYAVYLDALVDWPAETVRHACARLARIERREFEPVFPTLATVLDHCRMIQSETDRRRQLNAPKEEFKPISQEKFDAFLAQIRDALRGKVMR